MERITVIAGLGLALALASGCTLPSRGDVYSRGETRQAWNVDYGEVVDVDQVIIEGQRSALGRIGGGYVGYEVGRAVGGSGTSRAIGGAIGTVAGSVAGEAVEEGVTRQAGLQITVRLDTGRTLAIVQSAEQPFAVGENVKVYSRGDGAARVAKR